MQEIYLPMFGRPSLEVREYLYAANIETYVHFYSYVLGKIYTFATD